MVTSFPWPVEPVVGLTRHPGTAGVTLGLPQYTFPRFPQVPSTGRPEGSMNFWVVCEPTAQTGLRTLGHRFVVRETIIIIQ